MGFSDHFKDMCQDTATWKPLASQDGYGVKTYGAAVTLSNVRLVKRNQKVRDERGDEVVSNSQLWAVGSGLPSMNVEGEITLSTGEKPQIIAVDQPQDETGEFTHAKIFFVRTAR